MNLIEYIQEHGDERVGKLLKINPRTVRSWRLKERHPSRKAVQQIIKKTPITLTDIYGGSV